MVNKDQVKGVAKQAKGSVKEAAGKVTATCRGVFVAVKEGHPAYHRWG